MYKNKQINETMLTFTDKLDSVKILNDFISSNSHKPKYLEKPSVKIFLCQDLIIMISIEIL